MHSPHKQNTMKTAVPLCDAHHQFPNQTFICGMALSEGGDVQRHNDPVRYLTRYLNGTFVEHPDIRGQTY